VKGKRRRREKRKKRKKKRHEKNTSIRDKISEVTTRK
jgi:hypothetical protein